MTVALAQRPAALSTGAGAVPLVAERRAEIEPEREPPRDIGGTLPQPPPISGDDGPPIFDEAAESAFRAEARDRGEVVVSTAKAPEPEDADPKALPTLDSLVQRIPADVRDTLEDLFRARFVRVQRVPRKHLKK